MAFDLKSPHDMVASLNALCVRLIKDGKCHTRVVNAAAGVHYEHINDRVVTYLDVRHEVSASFASNPSPIDLAMMADYLRAALLIRDPTVKARKVERRLMLVRGAQARKSKAKRT
jgi:hypothetical protein